MANGTVIPVNQLTRNAFTAGTAITSCTLDTGTVAVTVPTAAIAAARSMVNIYNSGTGALTVVAVAGTNPPAQRSGIGSVSQSVASSATYVFGPAETMQFGQGDGTIKFTFTPAGTLGATITCYELPKA